MDNQKHLTFCPAKWDELFVNLNYNFVYSCCTSTPIRFVDKADIATILNGQKDNLLNGVQDNSCEYCWRVERQGHPSKRHTYLKDFNFDSIEKYKDNPKPQRVELNLGNECNFQCTYCNPKFSSQWATDVKNKSYKIFSDKDFYSYEDKQDVNITDTIDWLKNYTQVKTLSVLGGEPLQNKNLFKVLDEIPCEVLTFNTNLSCKTFDPIDRIIKIAPKYKTMRISISLDSTGANAEFSRFGLDYELIIRNINYILEQAPDNVQLVIASVMTSFTIRDLTVFADQVKIFKLKRPDLLWNLVPCQEPKILSLNTLPDQFKSDILVLLEKLKDEDWIIGLAPLVSVLQVSKFNNTLYSQMKHFLEEFSSRKGIKIPVDLNL